MSILTRHKTDEEHRNRLRCVKSVDDMFVGLMQALEETGLDQDTWVFVSSDHAYSQGSFRLPSRKSQMYEDNIKVFLYALPPSRMSRITPTVTKLVSMADMAPTILHLMNAPIPNWMDGSSIAPLLQGANNSSYSEAKALFLEYYGRPLEYHVWPQKFLIDTYNSTFVGLRTEDLVYTEFAQTSLEVPMNWNATNIYFRELYNLSADPYQLNNIIDTIDPSVVEALAQKLDQVRSCAGPACGKILSE